MRRDKYKPLDPQDARGAGTDRDGTVWVDGNERGVKSHPASEAYRRGWDLAFRKKPRRLVD